RGKGKSSGQTLLMFESHETGDLSRSTIRETQQAIIDLVKMDYQTFVNSVFLRQGHADEFTIADPAQRKEVLISILNLDQYDALEDHCKDEAKRTGEEIRAIELSFADIEAEITQKVDHEEALASYNHVAQTYQKDIAEQEILVTSLREKKANLSEKMGQLTKCRDELEKATREVERYEKAQAGRLARVEYYRELVQEKEAINKGYSDLQAARKELESYNEKLPTLQELERKASDLRQIISIEHGKLKSQAEGLKARCEKLRSYKPGICPTCGQAVNPEIEAKINAERESFMSEYSRLTEILNGYEEGPTFCLEEHKALQEVIDAKAQMDYDPEEHREVREKVKALVAYEEKYQRLQQAEQQLQHELEAVQQARQQIQEWTERRDAYERQARSISAEVGDERDLEEKLSGAEQKLSEWKQNLAKAQTEVASLEERLRRICELEERVQEKRRQLVTLREEEGLYKELAQAFNKSGIPSEIIKAAVPELEIEANRLLGDMTAGRMMVTLQTQREGKTTGTVSETLEILIADELGTRPYEMYSGGEAFKINLALRLALSKLVANRAGAPMSCLFIDEGFGTQDTNGLTKVIEAINAIKYQFNLVLVITHLDELKDAFPATIQVRKDVHGSKVEFR
ncbi:hypothetical protein ACFLXE_04825, partial [Chloroflexota bacterium]